MIDWERFGEKPTEDTLKDYPTILDIVKDIVAQEEERQIHKLPLDRAKKNYFYDFTRTGHYLLMRDDTHGICFPPAAVHSPFIVVRVNTTKSACLRCIGLKGMHWSGRRFALICRLRR